MTFLVVTMKIQCVILAISLILLKINFATAASFAEISEDCPKNTELECQEKDLYCCAKIGNQCCSEEDYFDQVK